MRRTLLQILALTSVLVFQVGCKNGEINEKATKLSSTLPELGLSSFSVLENSSNTFLFTLSRASDVGVTFTWNVTGPAAASRFGTTTASVTIPAGQTTATVPIPLVNDAIFQGDQTFTLTLSNVAAGVTVPVTTTTFVLTDDEAPPMISFALASQSVAENLGPASIVVRLSHPSSSVVSAQFTTGGTATAGADYALSPSTTVTFAAGVTSQTITASFVNDDVPEPDETIQLTLSTVTGRASVAGTFNVHVLTIANDDFEPFVSTVTSTLADGIYRAGVNIPVTVRFSQAVNVTGTPTLTLSTGRVATYASGSGTTDLLFNSVVQSGDQSADLDYQSVAALSGGTIVGVANGLTAKTALPAPGAAGSLAYAKALVIDTVPAVVTNVTSPDLDQAYGAGSTLTFRVTFSKVVNVTGVPTLKLETGAVDHSATYATGSGSSVLNFTYTVQTGDTSADLEAASTTALALAGGTIRDPALNDATLTLPAAGQTGSLSLNKNLILDTTVPTIVGVTSSKANGYYTVGELIPILVILTEPVTVTGTPRLTLETGATDRVIDFTSGSGTGTLVFNYVVQSGDTAATLDYLSTSALVLNGGTIKDAAGNPATLTLATPGTAGSLGLAKTITIDTVAPDNPRSVDDGTWTNLLTQSPLIGWQAGSDLTSGIDHYEVAIGTTPGGSDQAYWVANGTALTRTQYALTLIEGTRYYASVRAVDRAGNISGAATGDGFRADVTAPTTPATLTDGLTFASTTSTPTLTWATSSDALSGVSTYQVALGTTAGAIDALAWTDVGVVTTATLSALSLTEGATYYASVRARDVAGNYGAAKTGDGWVIGWLPQAYVKPAPNAGGAQHGSALAISGDTMVVGAPGGSGAAFVYVRSGLTWTQQAQLTAGNAESGDLFGAAVAIDGDTIVVGAPGEDTYANTIATTAPGTFNNFSADSGAAYIFVRSGTSWTLQAFAKASNEEGGDLYGTGVAISGDTVVIGAPAEESNVTGASTSASTNNSQTGAGAAYVLKRSGTTWTQSAYLKQAVARANSKFGQSVAIDGDTIGVGAPGDANASTTIVNGTGGATGGGATSAGAAYVFRFVSNAWAQEAFVKAPNADANDLFGTGVAISGGTLVVGAPGESSAQRTITNGSTAPATNGATNAGAAYVFQRAGVTWSSQSYLKAANADGGDKFGTSVAIDGDLILSGAPGEASSQNVPGQLAQTSPSNAAAGAGAAYLFRRAGNAWSELAYLKAANAGAGDAFGGAVGLKGETLSVGAANEASSQAFITNGQTASTDDGAAQAGAAYVFQR